MGSGVGGGQRHGGKANLNWMSNQGLKCRGCRGRRSQGEILGEYIHSGMREEEETEGAIKEMRRIRKEQVI